jgi:hypothetical protein
MLNKINAVRIKGAGGRNELPEKGYIPQGSTLVFSRKKSPCNNRNCWEASVPKLPSQAILGTMAACGSGIWGRK